MIWRAAQCAMPTTDGVAVACRAGFKLAGALRGADQHPAPRAPGQNERHAPRAPERPGPGHNRPAALASRAQPGPACPTFRLKSLKK